VVDLHTDGLSIGCVLRNLCCDPVRYFIRRWSGKSAILSSAVRSALFSVANIGAGLPAARSAFLTDFLFRAATAGFYGALTQAFRDIRPVRTGTLTEMIGALTVGHGSQSLTRDMCAIPALFTAFTKISHTRFFRCANTMSGAMRHVLGASRLRLGVVLRMR
jgi:hypothetical protein